MTNFSQFLYSFRIEKELRQDYFKFVIMYNIVGPSYFPLKFAKNISFIRVLTRITNRIFR